MRHFKRTLLPASIALAAALPLAGNGAAFAAQTSHTYWGKPVAIGEGSARTFVRTGATGKPVAVGVALTAKALEGLPPASPEAESWPYTLWMPEKGPKTGIDHMYVNWNPKGHPPPHIYTVPHFDFHFYYVSRSKQAEVSFTGAPGDSGLKPPPAALLPRDYRFIPATAVPDMGVHAPDMTSPEFHGKPFTATFIYGYYKGRLLFVEPMVTRAFLLSKPSMTSAVKRPERYSYPGDYPSLYRVRYDAAARTYIVEIDGLEPWKGIAKLSHAR